MNHRKSRLYSLSLSLSLSVSLSLESYRYSVVVVHYSHCPRQTQTTLHAHTAHTHIGFFPPCHVAFLGVTSVVPGATDSAHRHFTLKHNAVRNGVVQDTDCGGALCVLQINSRR